MWIGLYVMYIFIKYVSFFFKLELMKLEGFNLIILCVVSVEFYSCFMFIDIIFLKLFILVYDKVVFI